MANKKNEQHYIDNSKFFEAMSDWKELVIEAEESGEPRPPVSDYIGECFLKIAERLSYKPNFMNYPYREEMVGDGIENCLMYAHNFNPEKSKNPFSYFTQIIYYAFLRRIEKEKKQAYVKYKALEISDVDGSIRKYFKDNFFEKTGQQAMRDHFNLSDNDIEKFTPKKKKKKTKKKTDTSLFDDGVKEDEDSNNQ